MIIAAHSTQQLTWQKATASQPVGMCIEIAPYGDDIALRDSKHPEQGAFLYSRAELAAFIDGCRRGEFDHLT